MVFSDLETGDVVRLIGQDAPLTVVAFQDGFADVLWLDPALTMKGMNRIPRAALQVVRRRVEMPG